MQWGRVGPVRAEWGRVGLATRIGEVGPRGAGSGRLGPEQSQVGPSRAG